MISPEHYAAWVEDCFEWRGETLTGDFAHWCCDWDGLPVDETCREWNSCTCYPKVEKDGV